MGPKKRTKFHETINSVEEFNQIALNEENEKMVVIDAHLEWCGPCISMVPNYNSIWFSIDEPESRISFWHASENVIPDEMKEELKLTNVPRFLIYNKGELRAEIKGARFVELETKCMENLTVKETD